MIGVSVVESPDPVRMIERHADRMFFRHQEESREKFAVGLHTGSQARQTQPAMVGRQMTEERLRDAHVECRRELLEPKFAVGNEIAARQSVPKTATLQLDLVSGI